jgi:hypothetical protein
VLRELLPGDVAAGIGGELAPESYVGQPEDTVNAALAMWRGRDHRAEART